MIKGLLKGTPESEYGAVGENFGTGTENE